MRMRVKSLSVRLIATASDGLFAVCMAHLRPVGFFRNTDLSDPIDRKIGIGSHMQCCCDKMQMKNVDAIDNPEQMDYTYSRLRGYSHGIFGVID